MQTKGTVTKLDGAYAEVEVRRCVMCDGCPHDPKDPNACGHACAMGSLLGERKNMTVRVKNAKNAVAGDEVILESSDRTVLSAAFLFFILPLILAAALYAVAGAIFGSEASRWIGAAAGFFLAYAVGAAVERRARRNDSVIVMKEIARHVPD